MQVSIDTLNPAPEHDNIVSLLRGRARRKTAAVTADSSPPRVPRREGERTDMAHQQVRSINSDPVSLSLCVGWASGLARLLNIMTNDSIRQLTAEETRPNDMRPALRALGPGGGCRSKNQPPALPNARGEIEILRRGRRFPDLWLPCTQYVSSCFHAGGVRSRTTPSWLQGLESRRSHHMRPVSRCLVLKG